MGYLIEKTKRLIATIVPQKPEQFGAVHESPSSRHTFSRVEQIRPPEFIAIKCGLIAERASWHDFQLRFPVREM